LVGYAASVARAWCCHGRGVLGESRPVYREHRFPAIRADFPGAGLSGLSWVLNGYAIVFAALLVPAGRLADLLGRKRLFLGGLGLFLVASALCAAARGEWSLIAARVVQAVGAAFMIPTSLALLLRESLRSAERWRLGCGPPAPLWPRQWDRPLPAYL
jgi:MFS family permease